MDHIEALTLIGHLLEHALAFPLGFLETLSQIGDFALQVINQDILTDQA